jgi:hypothetical protein
MFALLSTGRFPEVIPTFHPRAGSIAGDSLAILTSPQQLIPAFCPSISGTTDGGLTVAIPADTGLKVMYTASVGSEWREMTAVGPCDTMALCFSFPGVVTPEQFGPPVLSTIVQPCARVNPYSFFQTLEPLSPDSCSDTGFAVTDPAPDSASAHHDPALGIPAASGGLLALSVWDPTTWDSYLFTFEDGDTSFAPAPEAWSSAMPRPDTCAGGPTPIAIGPLGEITACVLAEVGDSIHIGLQPWMTTSRDGGATWDDLVLLPAEAHGSALGDTPGRMPYGSFRGGTSWYGVQLTYAGATPLVFWTARRASADTSSAEERVWPSARALLCSYLTGSGWQTTYVGRAMVDSARAYDTPDWPTAILAGDNAVVLWSDLSEDGTNLDIWACGHDVGTGTWTVPATLTSTPGSEAFLEATGPVTAAGDYALLCSDERLLYGEPAPLNLLHFGLDGVWDAGLRTDVLPSPAAGAGSPSPTHLTLCITPNPAASSFSLRAPRGLRLDQVSLYDLAGRQQLKILDAAALQSPIPTSLMPPGTYLLVWRGDSRSGVLPLVVVR